MGDPIHEFLLAQSGQFQRDRSCPLCGHSFTFINATFWRLGQDEAWMVPLPICLNCQSELRTRKDRPLKIASSTPFDATAWKQAYIAALFETDKNKQNSRILFAQMAVVKRMRELFGAEGDNDQEKLALDAALYELHGVTESNKSSIGQIVAANDRAA
jgi:hypothetical protein